MKVIAYTALHYGLDYLAYAIRSVIEHVDEYWVLYSSLGSHGTRIDTPCPESRRDLFETALWAANDKLRWYDGDWTGEGYQRDTIFRLVPDADAILVLDSDEIWPWTLCARVIERLNSAPLDTLEHDWRAPMIHYWRSFHRAVLHDPAYPIRVILPHGRPAEMTLSDYPPINHMGYAQRTSLIQYKWQIHGHVSQLRTDIDWFKERWLDNAQVDCHPVGSLYWNPEAVNFTSYMPKWMVEHPFAGLEIIP